MAGRPRQTRITTADIATVAGRPVRSVQRHAHAGKVDTRDPISVVRWSIVQRRRELADLYRHEVRNPGSVCLADALALALAVLPVTIEGIAEALPLGMPGPKVARPRARPWSLRQIAEWQAGTKVPNQPILRRVLFVLARLAREPDPTVQALDKLAGYNAGSRRVNAAAPTRTRPETSAEVTQPDPVRVPCSS